jgi:hypothetical protein
LTQRGTRNISSESSGTFPLAEDGLRPHPTRQSGGQFISEVEDDAAAELATLVVGLITVAALPRSSPVGQGDAAAQVVRTEVFRLRDAPSEAERRHLDELTTTISQNIDFWIGATSPERHAALLAIRRVLPAIEPDVRRLAAANLDPRRIAFLVVDRARLEAPADFAEAAIGKSEQANYNVHVLRTLINRSIEHLQRIVLRDWVHQHATTRAPAPPTAAPAKELRPGVSDDETSARSPNFDFINDQLVTAMAAELSNVGGAVDALNGSNAGSDLETDIKELLKVQLNNRDRNSTHSPDALERPRVYRPPAVSQGQLPKANERPAEIPMAVEERPELRTPSLETTPLAPKKRSSVRFGFMWLVVAVAVGTTFAVLFHRGGVDAVAAALRGLFSSIL